MIDRGHKKWSASIMMPEHIEALKQIEESEKDIEKPILSEDQYEEIQRAIVEAIEYEQEIKVIYYKAKRLHSKQSKIKNINKNEVILDSGEEIQHIDITDIIRVD